MRNAAQRGAQRNLPYVFCFGINQVFRKTKRKTEGPQHFACVSGNFQGKQRVFGSKFGAPFWKLASFPESESWSGAKSEAKLRKSANYPGIFQVCTMKKLVYPQNTGILLNL